MPLSQRSILAFCSVVLFLVGLSLAENACELALNDIFLLAHQFSDGFNFNHDEVFMTPDAKFITTLVAQKQLNDAQKQKNVAKDQKWKRDNEAILTNFVEFIPNMYNKESIRFTLKIMNNNKKGTATFFCIGEVCEAAIAKLRESWNDDSKQLTCLNRREKPVIGVDQKLNILVSFPWGSLYVIVRGNEFLASLVDIPETFTKEDWKATTAELEGNTLTFLTDKGKLVVLPPLKPMSKAAKGYLEAVLMLFNISGQGIEFRFIPKEFAKQKSVGARLKQSVKGKMQQSLSVK